MYSDQQTTGSTGKKSSAAASHARGAAPRSARYGYRRFRNKKKQLKLLGSLPAPATVESENVVVEQNSVSQLTLGPNAKGEDERYPIKEQSNGISVLPLKPSKRKVCKYFAAEKSCYFGKYCRFLHIKNETDVNISGFVSSYTTFKPVRSIIRPNVAVVTKDDVGKKEQLDVRNSEINYFGRRFRDAKFAYDDNSCFIEFEYKVTDPEWIFEVKAVKLQLEIPEQYPCQSIMVALSETSLPVPFITYFNKEIKKFLEEKFLEAEKSNSYVGLGKTFIRWLDHNIFDLFVEGLRRTKMIVEAENEGIKLHQPNFSTCAIQEENNASETPELKLTSKLDAGGSNNAGMKEEHNYGKTEVELLSKQEISSSQPPKSKVFEVRFSWNDLNGNIATLTVVTLSVSIRCAKCSALSFLTCSAKQRSASYCLKCSNGYSVHVFPQHIHQNSNVIALLEPKGCLPLDCVLLSSKLAYVCMQCNKEATVENVVYGAVNKIWCYGCHSKCDFEITSIRFVGNFNSIAKEDSSLPKDKMRKRTKKKGERPLILVEGQPLPEKGTCKHYKKSYRWFRFPCCGKLYPCDCCHNDAEKDHDMKLANRMVCGFCSKEQPFQKAKPCINCNENVTRVKSQFWEGGKGCRDQVVMSRNDKRKHANSLMKTVSKKQGAQLTVKDNNKKM